MKRKILIFLLLLLVVGAAILFAWKWSLFPKEPILIAVVAPTGDPRGQSMLAGIEICREKTNREGGIGGRKIELLVYDDKNDPVLAEQIATKIAAENKALLVIGHYFSSASDIAGIVYRRNEIPAITGSATSESVTDKNDWYFRTIPTNRVEGVFMGNYISGILRKKDLSIIYCKDSYGLSFAKQIERTAKNTKMTVRKKWEFDLKGKDWDEQSKKIAAEMKKIEEPGIIVIATHAEEGANIVTALKDERQDLMIIGTHTFSEKIFTDKLKEYSRKHSDIGYYSDGIYFTAAYIADVAQTNPTTYEFNQEYAKKYGDKPTGAAACYHDAMLAAVRAMKKANIRGGEFIREDRRNIRKSLTSFYNKDTAVRGVTGHIFWNKQRDLIKESMIGIFHGDKPVPAHSEYHQITDKRSDNVIKDILEGGIILVDGNFMSNVRVIYTSMNLISVGSPDMRDRTFEAEFDLKFRYSGDFDGSDIVFENAASPVIAKPSEEEIRDGMKSRTYRIKGKFEADTDFRAYPADRHSLPIRFRHATLMSSDLIYVSDIMFRAEPVQLDIPPWKVRDISYYPNILAKPSTLGNPDYFAASHLICFSQFNADIRIRRSLTSSASAGIPVIGMVLMLSVICFVPRQRIRIRVIASMTVMAVCMFCHLRFVSAIRTNYPTIMEYVFFAIYMSVILIILSIMRSYVPEAVGDEIRQ